MPATKFKLVGLALLFAVANSQALTLGRMRGAALIGQGLDVTVQVQVDTDESLSAQCFEADVFHGDTRLEPSRLQLVVEPSQTAQMVNVRVSSPTLVDEPVVTVYLRSLCSQKSSRRYVLLGKSSREIRRSVNKKYTLRHRSDQIRFDPRFPRA